MLVNPLQVGPLGSGPRIMLTIRVDDVDQVLDRLATRGVSFLNGPVDRPWGRRTAAFADPAENVWETVQELENMGES